MKKALGIIIGALAFGAVAGTTMVGINVAANKTILAESGQNEDKSLSEILEEAEGGDEKAVEELKNSPLLTATTSEALKAQVLDVSDIVEEAMPQLVAITNTMVYKTQGYNNFFDYFYNMPQEQEYTVPASGSGVIIEKTDDELLIVTNNHVVADSKELDVTFVDDETVKAEIKGTDPDLDLAVIAVKLSDIPEDTLKAIKTATLHTEEDLKPGQGVIAIGNAMGYGQSVTVGYISALDRTIQTEDGGTESNLIQVDAAINPGNSGGALLNMQGELIGINVAKMASSQVDSVGYSIPIYRVTDAIENLSNAKTRVEVDESKQGALGVVVTTVTEEQSQLLGIPKGAIIKEFDTENGSSAEDAGLLKNDIITKVDGQSIRSADDLVRQIKYYEQGETLTLTYERLEGGEYTEHTAEVTLGKKAPVEESEASSDSGSETQPGENESREESGSQGDENGASREELQDLFNELFGGYMR